jgi:hypothetical protein
MWISPLAFCTMFIIVLPCDYVRVLLLEKYKQNSIIFFTSLPEMSPFSPQLIVPLFLPLLSSFSWSLLPYQKYSLRWSTNIRSPTLSLAYTWIFNWRMRYCSTAVLHWGPWRTAGQSRVRHLRSNPELEACGVYLGLMAGGLLVVYLRKIDGMVPGDGRSCEESARTPPWIGTSPGFFQFAMKVSVCSVLVSYDALFSASSYLFIQSQCHLHMAFPGSGSF